MKVRWETQLLGMPVVDQDGRRLGRMVAAYCSDPDTVVWCVLRLPGTKPRRGAPDPPAGAWSRARRAVARRPHS